MTTDRRLMPGFRLAAAAIIASLPLSLQARAEPSALVIGNASYNSTALPPLPGCLKSANTVSAALRTLGIRVIGVQDASTGSVDAGINEFTQHLGSGGGIGFVYICGYATDFNNRSFVLPTTARIDRPSDVLTQGVIAKSLLGTVSHDPGTVGVVVYDMVPKPDGPPKLALDALAGLPVPDGIGIIAATETTPADAPTPLAAALVTALAGPRVSTDGLLGSVRTQLNGSALTTVSFHMPAAAGFLAGAPPPAAVQTPAPPPPVPAPAAQPVAAGPTAQLPDEAEMTDTDRRKVQSALVRLGYYAFPVDGLFGPETRAAIRRYQHEINSETTGRLMADQATRLVNTR
jgi:hypothetical protein